MDLFEYQGKQYFARFDIPVPSGEVANTVDEAVAAADKIGYPGRDQGAGAGRRARQSGRHPDRQQRRRSPHPRDQHPRHEHQGTHRPAPVGRKRLGHRRRILRLVHARPQRQAVSGHDFRQRRRRNRAGRQRRPGRAPHHPHRPGGRFHAGDGARFRQSRQPESRKPSIRRFSWSRSSTTPLSKATPIWSRSTR